MQSPVAEVTDPDVSLPLPEREPVFVITLAPEAGPAAQSAPSHRLSNWPSPNGTRGLSLSRGRALSRISLSASISLTQSPETLFSWHMNVTYSKTTFCHFSLKTYCSFISIFVSSLWQNSPETRAPTMGLLRTQIFSEFSIYIHLRLQNDVTKASGNN
jgi:hypothetical protein